jgi:hypothetical protein
MRQPEPPDLATLRRLLAATGPDRNLDHDIIWHALLSALIAIGEANG